MPPVTLESINRRLKVLLRDIQALSSDMDQGVSVVVHADHTKDQLQTLGQFSKAARDMQDLGHDIASVAGGHRPRRRFRKSNDTVTGLPDGTSLKALVLNAMATHGDWATSKIIGAQLERQGVSVKRGTQDLWMRVSGVISHIRNDPSTHGVIESRQQPNNPRSNALEYRLNKA